MNPITRRNLLKSLLGRTVQAATAVVLACAVPLANASDPAPANEDLLDRADRATESLTDSEGDSCTAAFVNGGFRNGGGAFRNGGFANGGGGSGFKNGGFANGGGGFRNGAFANGGGFKNGTFNNAGGAFRNGGFANGGGFRNGTFRNY
jgi:hypothetical protein